MNNAAENVEPIRSAPRKKSQETVLKQDMARIKRELVVLDGKIEAFEKMKDEMDGMAQTRTELEEKLESVKHELIAELGLD